MSRPASWATSLLLSQGGGVRHFHNASGAPPSLSQLLDSSGACAAETRGVRHFCARQGGSGGAGVSNRRLFKSRNASRIDWANHLPLSNQAARLSPTQTPVPRSRRCPPRSTLLGKHWPTPSGYLA